MNKILKENVEKKFRMILEPLKEYELIVKDGIGHPKRLDVLKETVWNFKVMELGEQINCVESATIGWILATTLNPIVEYWSNKMDEGINNDERLEKDIEHFGRDLDEHIRLFYSNLPQIKARIRQVSDE